MPGILLLLAQGLIYFGVMAALFRARRVMGIGAFMCALGVMHFLETYLATVFFVQLPFGVVSPGSTVLFSGKLAIILLCYLREDAETVRQPIYGLLALIDQMGALMVWGTTLLFLDSIAMILLYEHLHRLLPTSLVLRAAVCLAIVLSFDQVSFFVGLHLVTGAPWAALFGGWVAKLGAALVYAVLIGAYLRFCERKDSGFEAASLSDVFSTLTYRRRYEELLRSVAYDAVTGALTRERFEAMGREAINRSVTANRPVTFAMIDIDNFKQINDAHGHLVGDRVLRGVVEAVRSELRTTDAIFRYGGDEFVLMFENMPQTVALGLLQRIGKAIKLRAAPDLPGAVTVSIGAATCPEDDIRLPELIRFADAQLYAAKRSGRDRVAGASHRAA